MGKFLSIGNNAGGMPDSQILQARCLRSQGIRRKPEGQKAGKAGMLCNGVYPSSSTQCLPLHFLCRQDACAPRGVLEVLL